MHDFWQILHHFLVRQPPVQQKLASLCWETNFHCPNILSIWTCYRKYCCNISCVMMEKFSHDFDNIRVKYWLLNMSPCVQVLCQSKGRIVQHTRPHTHKKNQHSGRQAVQPAGPRKYPEKQVQTGFFHEPLSQQEFLLPCSDASCSLNC